MVFSDLLKLMKQKNASDLFITAGVVSRWTERLFPLPSSVLHRSNPVLLPTAL